MPRRRRFKRNFTMASFNAWFYGPGDDRQPNLNKNPYGHSWRRSPLLAEVRRVVLLRDKRTCQQCGSREHPTVDHIIPVSRGGAKYDESNLQVLCDDCNNLKGSWLPSELVSA